MLSSSRTRTAVAAGPEQTAGFNEIGVTRVAAVAPIAGAQGPRPRTGLGLAGSSEEIEHDVLYSSRGSGSNGADLSLARSFAGGLLASPPWRLPLLGRRSVAGSRRRDCSSVAWARPWVISIAAFSDAPAWASCGLAGDAAGLPRRRAGDAVERAEDVPGLALPAGPGLLAVRVSRIDRERCSEPRSAHVEGYGWRRRVVARSWLLVGRDSSITEGKWFS